MQPARVIRDTLAVVPLNGEQVVFSVNARDTDVFPRLDAYRLTASSVAYDVTGFVLCGPPAVGPGHLLARHQHSKPVLLLSHSAVGLQLAVDSFVNLLARSVVRGYHEGRVRSLGISLGYCLQAFFPVRDFMHTALLPEIVNRLVHMTVGELLDSLFQCGVFLANDLMEVRCVHPGFLKLLERSPPLHSLVLARVAHEDHAVLCFQPAHEFVNLARAREARFVHNVQMPLSLVLVWSRSEGDFVFPSVWGAPRDADKLREKVLQPAADRAKIGKIGWHSLRHSFATALDVAGARMKVAQELMRHSSITTTMDVYTGTVERWSINRDSSTH